MSEEDNFIDFNNCWWYHYW